MTSIAARSPKLWVLCIHVAAWLGGVITGFSVWYPLGQPGKDPLAELYRVGPIGLAIAAAAYGMYFKRTWRLSPRAIAARFPPTGF